MAVDDYLESEVAVAAAATAALLSPPVRRVMRRGLVYATAGVMTAGDAVVSAVRGAGRGMQQAVAGDSDGAHAGAEPTSLTPSAPGGMSATTP